MRREPLNRIRMDGMHKDTALYENSGYIGFVKPQVIDDKMAEYRNLAMKAAESESLFTQYSNMNPNRQPSSKRR